MNFCPAHLISDFFYYIQCEIGMAMHASIVNEYIYVYEYSSVIAIDRF